ncbi:F-box protein SKIP23-like [Cornus florida]|uniref:F-box protein SKIP23-like n=1 Tax=Cornus florida TaxID=4283 RepID=UPI00289A8E03|nr:F-box protein SKIP23-like [Cornus florida]
MADMDWSQLPYDLISTIANRLNVVEDFLSFSGVCQSWRSVYWTKNWRQKCLQFPWLMLSSSSHGGNNNNAAATFFSFLKKKRLQLSLVPQARRWWGSACGWLVSIGGGGGGGGGHQIQIHLLNPITRLHINLPYECSIHKLFVFNTTSFPSDQMGGGDDDDDIVPLVVAICGPRGSDLAFVRPGDDSWVMVAAAAAAAFKFLTLFQTHIFAICEDGSLVMVEIESVAPSVIHIAAPPNYYCWGRDGLLYLVESLGDLLLICRYETRSITDFCPQTVSFQVYKFDFGVKEWMELDDLGDRALFVGDHFSVSLSASDFPNCKSNSIYFTHDRDSRMMVFDEQHQLPLPPQQQEEGRLDMGIYNMTGRSIESFDLGDHDFPLHDATPPIWFMPTGSS